MLGWSTAEQRLGIKSLVLRSHEDCGQRTNKRTCIVSRVSGEKAIVEILRYSAYLLTVLSSSGLAIVKGSLFPALATLFDYFMHSIMPSNLSLCACLKCARLWVYVHVWCVCLRGINSPPASCQLDFLWRDWINIEKGIEMATRVRGQRGHNTVILPFYMGPQWFVDLSSPFFFIVNWAHGCLFQFSLPSLIICFLCVVHLSSHPASAPSWDCLSECSW